MIVSFFYIGFLVINTLSQLCNIIFRILLNHLHNYDNNKYLDKILNLKE